MLCRRARIEAFIGNVHALLGNLPLGHTARIEAFIGNVHALLGNLPKGLKAWIRSIKLDPSLRDARQNVIKTLTDQGRHSEALKHARTGAKVFPDEKEFAEAIRLEPTSFSAHFSLGVAHRSIPTGN
ncbi:hypothetical protein T484DRAFT_1788460 [Baffinella frigidus]|nr:hypothetical protein T484DRAFT_1788460 [Cryptophyta sp. CCMP2293]